MTKLVMLMHSDEAECKASAMQPTVRLKPVITARSRSAEAGHYGPLHQRLSRSRMNGADLTTTRFFPFFFASYNAWSALPMRLCAVSPAEHSATPQLSDTGCNSFTFPNCATIDSSTLFI